MFEKCTLIFDNAILYTSTYSKLHKQYSFCWSPEVRLYGILLCSGPIGNKFTCAARLYGLSRHFYFLVSCNFLYLLVVPCLFLYVWCQINNKQSNKNWNWNFTAAQIVRSLKPLKATFQMRLILRMYSLAQVVGQWTYLLSPPLHYGSFN